MRRLILLGCLLILCGCGSRSAEDIREEGRTVTRTLTEELRTVHNRRELMEAAPKLKTLFRQLAELMAASQEFQEPLDLEKTDHDLSDELRLQMNRIYQMDGGRQIMEQSQQDAVRLL